MFTVESQDTNVWSGRGLTGPLFALLSKLGQHPRSLAFRLKRRTDWFTNNLTVRKALNTMAAVGAYASKRTNVFHWPVFVVVDISPLCNLHCTVCLHAYADGNPDLLKQKFDASQRMSVGQYERLVEGISKYSLGVVLYYVGDPIVHPQLMEICRATHRVGLNSHVSTNFSISLNDRQLEELVESGLTHLTVCVDGVSQSAYERTRVGGRLAVVVDNLRRVCAIRKKTGRRLPQIEVQYIKYRHNIGRLKEAYRFFRGLGVDQVHELWGGLHNYTDRDPGKYSLFGAKRPGRFPRCHWPYLFTVVKYDGTVLPCCSFRLGEQYTECDDPRHVGNALRSDLMTVWSSAEYEEVRRSVNDPCRCDCDSGSAKRFCYACPRLFNTDYGSRTSRFASEYSFEELYTIGADNRPHRRPETIPVHRI